jgi:hypothetical protein
MQEQLINSVRGVIDLLVAHKYTKLEALTNGVHLKASDMDRAITEYGRRLVPPPENAIELMDVAKVRNASDNKWSITMPLWTQEEGRSDLSVELTLIHKGKSFAIELDDIHVL